MPGLFGVAGHDPRVHDALRQGFCTPWTDVEFKQVPGGVIGGHAFPPGRALHVANGADVAVDGEVSIYRDPASGRGNVVTVRPDRWEITTEWAGTFPLYYAHDDRGLMFSSRVKPLARVAGAEPDPVALREFLAGGYTNVGRTFFRGIRRLMPGQTLAYDPATRALTIGEASQAWAGIHPETRPEPLAEHAWSLLTAAVRAGLPSDVSHALMLSAGWDSRTLFAATTTHVSNLFCHSHGDLESRELAIIRRLRGTLPHGEESSANAYDLDALRRGFERVESVLFPDWHRAGAVLAQRGIGCVSAGVYGEILGGHYGPTHVFAGGRKIVSLLGHLFRMGGRRAGPEDLLFVRGGGTPWYLDRGAWPERIEDEINADITATLDRLKQRGVSRDQMVEAFISEARGTQYINAQLLSCRIHTDIALPFTDRELLRLASWIPIDHKVHNLLNREILHRHRPDLLRYATAAILVPAGWPILLQEASRATRRGYEAVKWQLHFRGGGHVSEPRFGAWNVEFLRDGGFFDALADDLRSDLWNKAAIKRRIAEVRRLESKIQVATLPQMMLRAYTIDLMLR